MASEQLTDYVRNRIYKGETEEEIKSYLKSQGYSDTMINESFSEVNNINFTTKDTIYMFSLLIGGIIIILIGMTSINATRTKFPNFVGLLMIITSFIVFLGRKRIREILIQISEMKKDTEKKM